MIDDFCFWCFVLYMLVVNVWVFEKVQIIFCDVIIFDFDVVGFCWVRSEGYWVGLG